ncbi:18783_t:CDS:1, partial [Gigaspora rosea]
VQVQMDELESDEETIKKLKEDIKDLKQMVQNLIANRGGQAS